MPARKRQPKAIEGTVVEPGIRKKPNRQGNPPSRPGKAPQDQTAEDAGDAGLIEVWLLRYEMDRESDDEGTLTRTFVPPDNKRCVALTRSGHYRGSRCVKWRARGTRVCMRHGAQLPNVRKNALKNLLGAADDAVSELIRVALLKRNVSDADKIKAISQLLDRAGVVGKQEIEVTNKPWQKMLRSLAGDEDVETSEVDDEQWEAPEAEPGDGGERWVTVIVDWCETCDRELDRCKCEVEE